MSWCVFIPRSTGTHSDISACFFLAPAEMCPFRGVLIQCFGASSQHTAVDAIGMHIHPRLTSGVTEMWHLRCHVVSGSMHPHPHHVGLSPWQPHHDTHAVCKDASHASASTRTRILSAYISASVPCRAVTSRQPYQTRIYTCAEGTPSY